MEPPNAFRVMTIRCPGHPMQAGILTRTVTTQGQLKRHKPHSAWSWSGDGAAKNFCPRDDRVGKASQISDKDPERILEQDVPIPAALIEFRMLTQF